MIIDMNRSVDSIFVDSWDSPSTIQLVSQAAITAYQNGEQVVDDESTQNPEPTQIEEVEVAEIIEEFNLNLTEQSSNLGTNKEVIATQTDQEAID